MLRILALKSFGGGSGSSRVITSQSITSSIPAKPSVAALALPAATAVFRIFAISEPRRYSKMNPATIESPAPTVFTGMIDGASALNTEPSLQSPEKAKSKSRHSGKTALIPT